MHVHQYLQMHIPSGMVADAPASRPADQHHGGRDGAAGEDAELILWRRSSQVVCAVTDPGTGIPVLARPDPFGEAGRGLHVVQALSAAWGWTRLGDSKKAVWAAMGVPGADVSQQQTHSRPGA